MKKIFTFIIFSSLLMFISCATSSTNAIDGQGSYFDTVAKNADLWHIIIIIKFLMAEQPYQFLICS